MADQNASHTKAVQDFLAEAEEIVEQLGSELADLLDGSEGDEVDPDILNSIFRGAHSLKGLAGMFNFSGIADLSHNMENLLDLLRLGKLTLSPAVISALFTAQELLHSLIRTLDGGEHSSMDTAIAHCISTINACLAPSDPSVEESLVDEFRLPEHIRGALTEYEEHRLKDNMARGRSIFIVKASFDLTTFDTELSALTTILKKSGELISTLPSVGDNLESQIDFEFIFGTKISRSELQTLVEYLKDITVTQLISSAALDVYTSSELPNIPCVLNSPASEENSPSSFLPSQDMSPRVLEGTRGDDINLSAKSMSRTVRVNIVKLDELMNIVGELVLANSAIAGVASRLRNEGYSHISIELGKAAKQLERRLSDLQRGVMEIRMVPIGQLYEKMARIVRKISREQGKRVELKFFGSDTELDKLIVEDISDPLMHIIRNAIDHGIESSDVRVSQGKSELGTIQVSSFQKGNHVVIEIEDDGAGIDIEKVKKKALQKGLVTDIRSVTDHEAIDFIFLPGFSTNDSVSEVSGRGVGMDVVKNNISEVSGMVDVDTSKGKGSRFIITLPITLAIIKVLIVNCNGRTYGLPITSVLESLLMTDSDIMTIERKEVVHLRDSTLPLLRLDSYFNIRRDSVPPAEFYVVVVGAAEKRLGLVVDDLICQQDIVIKPLGESFKQFRGISGAADLGDQRTILILDISGIIHETMRSGS